MPLRIGETFAGYRVLRLLGAGGMGEVYLVQHPRLPRQEALKVLRPDISTDASFRERFIREADLAAGLRHPHIVGIHDRGEEVGHLWISMDYIDGTDTAHLIQQRYPAGMPADEVVTIVTAVAGALDYAHQKGLLHRDVKPANILLSQPDDDGERRVFLADFGIARELADPSGLTATNLTVGTVAYAAPEQLMGSELDGRADEYALAASAFHLFTGAPPFQHSSPVAVIGQHLNSAPPTLSEKRPELSALDGVLATALAKTPAERFATSGQFAKALSERVTGPSISDHATQEAVTPPLPAPDKRTVPDEKRRRPRIVIGAAIAVVVLTVIGVIGYHMKHTTPPSPAAAGPVLDGTYRFVYDYTKQTRNGAPSPAPNADNISWSAFRSHCTTAGCVATRTGLDAKKPQVARNPAVTSTLHFVDGQWQETPTRTQVNYPQCLGVDGKVVPGAETQLSSWSVEPQPGGALRGTWTVTVLTMECGAQGDVTQIPFVASRTGDVPAGVVVADPAGMSDVPSTTAAPPPPPGPVLNGTYRLDIDTRAGTQHNPNTGATGGGGTDIVTGWWAFRSLCTATHCVATGARLSDNNQQVPTGGGMVLAFSDGRWQSTPALQTDTGSCGKDADTVTWSLEPQADGTLHGDQTITIISNECGFQGLIIKSPCVATRIDDVPPAAILADPALFLP